MTDTEKKIAEIRAKVTPVKQIPRGTGETLKLLFNIQFLLDELDRLRAERDSHGPEGRNYTNKQYVDLLAERNKLIEGLRSIRNELDRLSRESRQKWKREGDMYEQGRADAYDEADVLIRDILKECGVAVD